MLAIIVVGLIIAVGGYIILKYVLKIDDESSSGVLPDAIDGEKTRRN